MCAPIYLLIAVIKVVSAAGAIADVLIDIAVLVEVAGLWAFARAVAPSKSAAEQGPGSIVAWNSHDAS